MNAECRHCSDAAAFLADELSPRERADFQLHLVQCAECREAVESTRNLLGRLLAVPRAEPTRDLASGVLARLHEPVVKMPRRPTWTHIAAAAAAIAVLGAGLLMRDVTRGNLSPSSQVAVDTAANTDRALDWFVRAQEQDGSWNAERWGGLSNYAPALTALPMLALLNADDITPERETAATRAAANLLALQNADGSFGPVFHGSPYNHSITTFALLHAWQRRPDIVPKAALDAALAALAARQTPGGGWGYRHSPVADRSITQWHIQALHLATTLGWSTTRPFVERGLGWIAAHSNPLDESAEPADSTSALLARATARPSRTNGSLDFYQVYFAATALRHERTPAAQQRLASLRNKIIRHQITEGAESGSWPPDDQWGRAGGRLYSTALASLSLKSL